MAPTEMAQGGLLLVTEGTPGFTGSYRPRSITQVQMLVAFAVWRTTRTNSLPSWLFHDLKKVLETEALFVLAATWATGKPSLTESSMSQSPAERVSKQDSSSLQKIYSSLFQCCSFDGLILAV